MTEWRGAGDSSPCMGVGPAVCLVLIGTPLLFCLLTVADSFMAQAADFVGVVRAPRDLRAVPECAAACLVCC